MHLRTFVDMHRRLRSSTFVFRLLLLNDQERLYLTLSERKCICAQLLNCANGCAVYYFLSWPKKVHFRSLVPERICICYCYSYVLERPCALDLVWQGKKSPFVPERICICYCYSYVLGRPCALDLVWQVKK
jgi:hypothetical protein